MAVMEGSAAGARSYLSSLTVGSDNRITGADGSTVSMTVDGVPTAIDSAHTYTGDHR
jgi:hypothetical protein